MDYLAFGVHSIKSLCVYNYCFMLNAIAGAISEVPIYGVCYKVLSS